MIKLITTGPGGTDVLEKPFDSDRLLRFVRRALEPASDAKTEALARPS